jgi:bidirectional [NiFe] hydrogenase diaphorase subunit
VFNQDVDLLQILKTLARFFVHETCGQCMPCRLGTNQIHTLLGKIADGNGSTRDLEKLGDVCRWMRAITLCGLGQTAPSAVISALTYFKDEFESLIQSSQAAELRAG